MCSKCGWIRFNDSEPLTLLAPVRQKIATNSYEFKLKRFNHEQPAILRYRGEGEDGQVCANAQRWIDCTPIDRPCLDGKMDRNLPKVCKNSVE